MSEVEEYSYCEEAEMALLGSLMLSHHVCEDVMHQVTEEMFFYPRHQTIFRAMQRVMASGAAVDMITVRNDLELRKELNAVGGVKYLAVLHDALPSVSAGRHYAQIVKDRYRLRSLCEVATKTLDLVKDRSFTTEQKIEQVERMLESLHETSSGTRELSGMEAMLNMMTNPSVQGIPTGELWIDEQSKYGGLYAGGLHLIAAATGKGKSELACKLAASLVRAKKRVAFGVFEMSAEQTMGRIIKYLSRGQLQEYASTNGDALKAEEWNAISRDVGESGLEFFDGSGAEREVKVLDFLSWCNRQHRHGQVNVVIADYVQLLRDATADQHEKDHEMHVRIIRRCRSWARKTGVPVVLCVQVNDDGTTRGSRDYKTNCEMMLVLSEVDDKTGVSGAKYQIEATKNRHGDRKIKCCGGFEHGLLKFWVE